MGRLATLVGLTRPCGSSWMLLLSHFHCSPQDLVSKCSAMELNCYICNAGKKLYVPPEAVFNDGSSEICVGHCRRCGAAVCTNHGAWFQTPLASYQCSICAAERIYKGGGGPLHWIDPESGPTGGGGGAVLAVSPNEVLQGFRHAGLVRNVLSKLRETFIFWAERETGGDLDLPLSAGALRNVRSVYLVESRMAEVVKILSGAMTV